MKYTLEIEIDRPRSEVVKLFENPENLKEWQPGFKSMELISGEAGTPLSKTRMVYQMGKRQVEMVETIQENTLPDTFHATYEAKGMWNRVDNYFYESGPDKTRWVTENEFRGSGIMWFMPILMPGAFKKQSFQFLEKFKAFAEAG